MDRSNTEHLMRALIDQRFRVGNNSWVVTDCSLENGQLQLDLTTTARFSVGIDVPSAFDPLQPDHMAWLLAQIEAQLQP